MKEKCNHTPVTILISITPDPSLVEGEVVHLPVGTQIHVVPGVGVTIAGVITCPRPGPGPIPSPVPLINCLNDRSELVILRLMN